VTRFEAVTESAKSVTPPSLGKETKKSSVKAEESEVIDHASTAGRPHLN